MPKPSTPPPQRTVARAPGAMVSTGSALATRVALEILDGGATAFDAALGSAATLMVALPMSCGLGGDFALLGYDARSGNVVHAAFLGHAPAAATIEAFRALGHRDVPRLGALSATTPAASEALIELHARYGTRPLAELLRPAIRYAADGIEVNEQLSRWIGNNVHVVKRDPELVALYLENGAPLPVGARLRQPGLAQTLQAIADRGADYLRDPDRLSRLEQTSRGDGGLFVIEDFLACQRVDAPPPARRFDNRTVLVTALPTQGYLVLQNLAAYRRFAPPTRPLADAARIHLWSEIFNQTYGQRLRRAGDPRTVAGTEWLFDEAAVDEVVAAVNPEAMSPCAYDKYYESDTTHFVIGDKYGNLVSGIMSLSHGFGAGLCVSGTGIIFNSRLGRSATLNPAHPNCVGPGKRPINTIMVYLVVENGKPVFAGGTPGGDGQVQWNSVFLSRLLFDGATIERAIADPRFTCVPGADKAEASMSRAIQIERSFGEDVADGLAAYGHRVMRKRALQGCLRVVGRHGSGWVGADDGCEDGLTAGG